MEGGSETRSGHKKKENKEEKWKKKREEGKSDIPYLGLWRKGISRITNPASEKEGRANPA